MTTPTESHPVPVEIKNWSDGTAKPRLVKKTTLKTYVLDPAGVAGPKNVQISEYEPKRVRMVVTVIDDHVALLLEPPIISPDVDNPQLAPQGLFIRGAGTNLPYPFYGPDAMWLNSLAVATRVTVVKEYE